MITYLKTRRARKRARQVLRHARHLRHMREDVMSEDQLDALAHDEHALRQAVRQRADRTQLDSEGDRLLDRVAALTPKRSLPGLRENMEVIVVAVAVAMAFRAYFFQPFKIPTGSMQPTLFGITSRDKPSPGLMDRVPLRYITWALTGELYREVKVKRGGTLGLLVAEDGRQPYVHPSYPNDVYYVVAGARYRIPKHADVNYEQGEFVPKGAVLWRGSRTAGDHIFVNKISWNFRRPQRGEIMVFNTDGIVPLEKGLPRDRHGNPMSTHYVKRLVGLPEETITIRPPRLLADGEPVTHPRGIERIVNQEPGYEGYAVTGRRESLMMRPNESYVLADAEYFALGDNTGNSRDSRYWGPVPRKNLVGPACLIYWPFISDRQTAPPGRNGWQVGIPR